MWHIITRCCILIKGWETGCDGRRKYLEPPSQRLEAGAGGLKIQKVKVKLSDDRQRERWEIPLLKQMAKLWICVFRRACGRSCMNFLPELANGMLWYGFRIPNPGIYHWFQLYKINYYLKKKYTAWHLEGFNVSWSWRLSTELQSQAHYSHQCTSPANAFLWTVEGSWSNCRDPTQTTGEHATSPWKSTQLPGDSNVEQPTLQQHC